MKVRDRKHEKTPNTLKKLRLAPKLQLGSIHPFIMPFQAHPSRIQLPSSIHQHIVHPSLHALRLQAGIRNKLKAKQVLSNFSWPYRYLKPETVFTTYHSGWLITHYDWGGVIVALCWGNINQPHETVLANRPPPPKCCQYLQIL